MENTNGMSLWPQHNVLLSLQSDPLAPLPAWFPQRAFCFQQPLGTVRQLLNQLWIMGRDPGRADGPSLFRGEADSLRLLICPLFISRKDRGKKKKISSDIFL